MLLPGFLCARIVQTLCVRPEQSEIDKVLESLLYSFLVYLCFLFTFGQATPIKISEEVNKESKKVYSVEVERGPLAALIGFSAVLGILLSANKTRDWSGRLFRWAKISQRTTRSSVWEDVFHEQSCSVLVGLGDGRRIIGWATHYSDDPHEGSLFIKKAAWIDEEHKEHPINGPGILITSEAKIEYVEFLDYGSPATSSTDSVSQPHASLSPHSRLPL